MSLILKRSLIFIGLMLVGLMLYSLRFGMKADGYDETVIPYLDSAVPALTSWQYDRLAPLLSPGARRDFENEGMRTAYRSYSKLGQFQSMDKPRFVTNLDGSSEALGDVEFIDYEAVLQFDSGPAVIKVKLIAAGTRYYIHHFGLQSEVFADQNGAVKN